MYSPNPSIIVSLIQKELELVPYPLVLELLHALGANYPSHHTTPFELLLAAITTELQNKTKASPQTNHRQDIISKVVAQATRLNQQLGLRLKSVLTSYQFTEYGRSIIEKTKSTQLGMLAKESMMNRVTEKKQEKVEKMEKMEKMQDLGRQEQGKVKSQFNFQVIKGPNQKCEHMNMNRLAQNKNTEHCRHLTNRPQCLCPNEREITLKDDHSFQCLHCHRLFHTLCMKKKPNSQFCPYCHIERMVPLRKVIRTVYLGLFKKNVKKHQTTFFVPELEPNQKFQVRCLRLKEGAPASCLFPDMTEIRMNSHSVKEFEPINKQSCLKYRKDQPFMLLKGDYYANQENTLVLNEAIVSIKDKDVRCESENHLFGVFVIEELKIDSLISFIKSEGVLGYSESAAILSDSFTKFGKGDDELICELVKIPLSCPLSTVRIETPVRGIFCDHFQCFDLKNYLTLISESVNPRWNCPLCKAVTYELVIDPIINEILKNIKGNDKVQEILFFRNGDYTAIIDDEPDSNRHNIRGLKIPEKKHVVIPEIIEEKIVKKPFFIPEDVDVIDLD